MYLDFIKNTLYTQTMYAEFEDYIHEAAENNKQLNALVLNDKWSMLLKKYYGDDFEVDPLSMVGWARIPHFYNSFYVYKYATGFSAASALSKQILEEGESAVARYKEFLKSGGSDFPLNQLRKAGVDMEKKESVDKALEVFKELVDKLEK